MENFQIRENIPFELPKKIAFESFCVLIGHFLKECREVEIKVDHEMLDLIVLARMGPSVEVFKSVKLLPNDLNVDRLCWWYCRWNTIHKHFRKHSQRHIRKKFEEYAYTIHEGVHKELREEFPKEQFSKEIPEKFWNKLLGKSGNFLKNFRKNLIFFKNSNFLAHSEEKNVGKKCRRFFFRRIPEEISKKFVDGISKEIIKKSFPSNNQRSFKQKLDEIFKEKLFSSKLPK